MPPLRGEYDPYSGINGDPSEPRDPVVRETIEGLPSGKIVPVSIVDLDLFKEHMVIVDLRVPHHLEHVRTVNWRMWVFLSVRIYMVHTVHNTVGISTYVRRALCKKACHKEELLHERRHFTNSVSTIAMQEEGLTKKT